MIVLGFFIIYILVESTHCLDTPRLRDEGDFDSQLTYILDSISLSPEEMANVSKIYEDMEATMKNIWPDCRIEKFGATAAGLGLKTSDVDCFVVLPNTTNMTPEECIDIARNYLETQQNLFTDISILITEIEPILSCYHTKVERSVHLINTGTAYLRDTKLLHYYLTLNKIASNLAVFIKYWAKVHRVIGENLMPSFGIAMLVIFYLQQRNIVPIVRILQVGAESVVINHWETGFNEVEYQPDNNDTLYKLLGGFFEYYSTFDYDKDIIAPYLGRTVPRDMFANVDNVPEEYQLYIHNVKNNITRPLKLETKICIQDPSAHNGNSAALVCTELAEKIILKIQFAAKLYQETSSEDFLSAILDESLGVMIDEDMC